MALCTFLGCGGGSARADAPLAQADGAVTWDAASDARVPNPSDAAPPDARPADAMLDAPGDARPADAPLPDARLADAQLDDAGPAPDFTLPDLNPGSPTYGQDRSVLSAGGKVIVLYFATFG